MDTLEIENSKNSDENDFTEERPPPEPHPSKSGFSKPAKSITECRDQLTMRKDNYAYFVTFKGEKFFGDIFGRTWKITKFHKFTKRDSPKITKRKSISLSICI